jgi:hypothetical protein
MVRRAHSFLHNGPSRGEKGLAGEPRVVGVLSLYEASSGQVIEVATEHPRGFRVLVGATANGVRPRALLVADLIRRIAEWRGRQALVLSVTGGDAGGEDLAGALNVHPPNYEVGAADVAAQRFDICVGEAPDGAVAGRAVTVAVTEWPDGGPGGYGGPGPNGGTGSPPVSRGGLGGIAPPEATADGDLLAVRLVLLGTRYREAVTVDDQATKTAGQMLARWRERVAAWAQSPSGAPAARYLEAVVEAFENDLDTPAALREMAALEADETVTDGAKFETFAAADRLLGLDVASQVGRGLHNVRSVLRALTQRIAVRTHDRDTYLTRRSLYP